MAIKNKTDHDDHTVRIHLCRGLGPHYAALRCIDCNKHIQWISSGETQLLASNGVEIWKHYNTEGLGRNKYLDIPAPSRYKTETKDFWIE
jgi:hypothetical protein